MVLEPSIKYQGKPRNTWKRLDMIEQSLTGTTNKTNQISDFLRGDKPTNKAATNLRHFEASSLKGKKGQFIT